ncbi:DinB family protein [Alkalinema pantanalense CENA528]|uniref:DinB family protein n=1 Tax=Alkalinema pantanalense TaxID=1620705 RepID=UPI003D6F7908
MDRTYYTTMAEYNQWMNQKIYSACESISDSDRNADRGVFFKSIHGTLDHILWGDRMWLSRLAEAAPPTVKLGELLYPNFADLQEQRRLTDRTILAWASCLTPEWLNSTVAWRSAIDGQVRSHTVWILVTHFFNHQTHHRGQVTTLLTQLGHDIGSTDLPWMPSFLEK